jgi:hypothetical protein
MIYLNIYVLGFVFLTKYSRYDGGEEGGSIIDLIESLDRIMWPLIGTAAVIWVIKTKYTEIFVDKPREKEYHRQFNLDYPTIEEKQEYFNQIFLKEKLKVERDWKIKREEHLYKPPIYLPFDITDKAHYAERISRKVVKSDYSKNQGYSTRTEYWTYDGKWRQGYWEGVFDYSDKYWDRNTLCNKLNEKMGDIQPSKTAAEDNHIEKLTSKGNIQKPDSGIAGINEPNIDDDLPF